MNKLTLPGTCRTRPALVPTTRLAVVLLALLAVWGCGRPGPAETPDSPSPRQPAAGAIADEEIFHAVYLQGNRVGYEQITVAHQFREGRKLLRVDSYGRMELPRYGQTVAVDSRCTSWETPDGQLVEFKSQQPQGDVPMRTSGRVEGDQLRLEIVTEGKTLDTTIPWSDQYGGPYATELSLARSPLRPGQRRTIRAFDVGVNQLATIDLEAKRYEPVDLGGKRRRLLRIETSTSYAGQTLEGTLWTDRRGAVYKNRLAAIDLVTVRLPKHEALAKADPARFDLGFDTAVPVNRTLVNPHQTRRIVYRVKLAGGDPAAVFVSCGSQRVERLDAHTARVTVYAVRPGSKLGNPHAGDDPPGDEDLAPNNLVQCDDPKVVALAGEVAAGDDPWRTAVALEKLVHARMSARDFSMAFATASEVARTLAGDCTEHAVLLTALARARGIPARAAVGLVYSGRKYFYHMWTEVYIDDRWIPLDATLGQGGIGAAHLKVAHTSLQGASPQIAFLPVLKILGQLEIEIEEVE